MPLHRKRITRVRHTRRVRPKYATSKLDVELAIPHFSLLRADAQVVRRLRADRQVLVELQREALDAAGALAAERVRARERVVGDDAALARVEALAAAEDPGGRGGVFEAGVEDYLGGDGDRG